MADPTHADDLAELRRLITTSNNKEQVLAARGVALDNNMLLLIRMNMLADHILGAIDLDDPDATTPARLAFEIEWAEWLVGHHDRAILQTAAAARDAARSTSGLVLP